MKEILEYLRCYCSSFHGFSIKYSLNEELTVSTAVTFKAVLRRDEEIRECNITIPLPEDTGTFRLHNSQVMIVIRLIGNPKDFSNLTVIDPADTYKLAICESIQNMTYRLKHLGIWDEDYATTKIANFLTSSPYIRNVSEYMRQVEFKALMRTVVLEGVGDTPDDRKPCGWEGIIDPYTSPTSEKVGLVYQLASGAQIKDGMVTRGDHVLSQMNKENSIFPRLAPTQLYKVKSTFMKHLPLINGEHPVVRSTEYQGDLSGRHLLTAIMSDRYNQHDLITISQSAALKLTAHLYKAQIIQSRRPIELAVGIGDKVDCGAILGHSSRFNTELNEFEETEVRQSKLKGEAEITDISVEESLAGGVKINRVRVLMRCLESMLDGDKIITRHGAKGVVKILPDDHMPRTEDGQVVEVIVNPVSVVGRNNWAMFAEAAYHEKAEAEGRMDMPVDPDEIPVWDYLLDNGYGKKQQLLNHANTPYPHKTFCGNTFWLRTDSIARYRISAPGKVIPNFTGLGSDVSSISGSRVDITMRQILWSKNLRMLDTGLFKHYFSKRAADLAKIYADMLLQRVDSVVIEEAMDRLEINVSELVDTIFSEEESKTLLHTGS